MTTWTFSSTHCTLSPTSFAATLACLPSECIEVRRAQQTAERSSRTINDHLDLVINALHLVSYFINFTAYNFDTVTDAVCDPQDLRMRHPSLLLRQPIKLLEGTLEISHSG
jgi:hypothetical protein